jgi:hypothetical protein
MAHGGDMEERKINGNQGETKDPAVAAEIGASSLSDLPPSPNFCCSSCGWARVRLWMKMVSDERFLIAGRGIFY